MLAHCDCELTAASLCQESSLGPWDASLEDGPQGGGGVRRRTYHWAIAIEQCPPSILYVLACKLNFTCSSLKIWPGFIDTADSFSSRQSISFRQEPPRAAAACDICLVPRQTHHFLRPRLILPLPTRNRSAFPKGTAARPARTHPPSYGQVHAGAAHDACGTAQNTKYSPSFPGGKSFQ